MKQKDESFKKEVILFVICNVVKLKKNQQKT